MIDNNVLDPHIIVAILSLVGAGLILGALIIGFVIEAEMRKKK